MKTSQTEEPNPDPWGRFFHRRPTKRLCRAWLQGLGFNRAAPHHILLRLLDTGVVGFLFRGDLPPVIVEAAIVHPNKRVLGTIVESRILTAEQWERLMSSVADPGLREQLAVDAQHHAAARAYRERKAAGLAARTGTPPPATRAEIAEMAANVPDVDPGHVTHALDWVEALHGDGDAMRQLASSTNLWIRRSVARAPRLPEDVANRLARDEDRIVRLFLAESCDDAPAEMLLEVWAWWTGSLSFPGRPRNHPNFPRHNLLRFADDPDPRIRRLALDDPASTPALVTKFSRDADPEVRADVAKDPRLTADDAARLIEDVDQRVRQAAQTHPSLPRDLLVDLLLDERTAAIAARNPAIPTPAMRYMIKSFAAAK